MKKLLHICMVFCLLYVASVGDTCDEARAAVALHTDKSVHWASADGTTHVFLVQRDLQPQSRFSLYIAGTNNFTITYRTRVNSRTDIQRQLRPRNSSIKGLQEYEFFHAFSKTTIWMAIEFSKHGARANDLTRTFYGSLDKVVPNDEFLAQSNE